MARPPKDKAKKRGSWLPKVRITAAKLLEYKACADAAGYSMSEFIRRSCDNSQIVVRDHAFDIEAVRTFSPIANNLNQITRNAHMNGWLDPRELKELEDIRDFFAGFIRASTGERDGS